MRYGNHWMIEPPSGWCGRKPYERQQLVVLAAVLLCAAVSTLVLPVATSLSGLSITQENSAALNQAAAISLNSVFGLVSLALIRYFDLGRWFSHRAIFALALAMAICAALANPLLEDDHYRYLWDAYQWHTQGSPYLFAPEVFFADESLAWQWQNILTGINNPELKTIYGPVLQGLFLAAYWLAPGELWAWQTVLLLAYLLGLQLLMRMGCTKNMLLAYAVHPLIMQEALASAHPDLLVGIWLLLAFWAWQKCAPILMGVVLGLAVATKVSVLVVLPLYCLLPGGVVGNTVFNWRLFGGWLMRSVTAMMVVLVLVYLPVIVHSVQRSGGVSEIESLLVFGNHWRFNPLLFRLLDELLPTAGARLFSAAMVLITCLALIAVKIRWRENWRRLPVLLMLLVLLLMSPVVNPWYWLWLVPLAVYLNRWRVLIMAAVAPLSYCNQTVIAEMGLLHQGEGYSPFLVPWWATLVQLLIMLWVIVGEYRWCGLRPSN